MPTVRNVPGRLLVLLELAAERGGEPDVVDAAPAGSSAPWRSTDIFSAMNRANPGPKPGSASPPPPGHTLGGYHLIGRLGGGSEGDVWEAVRTSGGLTAVAIKLLKPELAGDPGRKAAFLRAADLGRRLVSTSLLPTLDSGEDGGFVYQTMPLVDGVTLAGAIALRLSPGAASAAWWQTPDRDDYARSVTRVLSRVARAAASAHASGLSHRDIKPANILLDRGRPGRAFLGDFGAGSDLGDPGPRPGDAEPGTPPYMPPERLLRRESDPVLGDVYSLGVTLYEALTLALPRPIPEGLPRSCLPTFLAAAEPVPPRAVCPWLSTRLESVVLRAIARNPASRHPSAAALADDLDRIAPTLTLPRR